MGDAFIPARRIDIRDLGEDFAKALAEARRAGETLEELDGGRSVAKVTPETRATDDAADAKRSMFGRGRGVVLMVTPGDTLADLFTDEETDDWYDGSLDPTDRRS